MCAAHGDTFIANVDEEGAENPDSCFSRQAGHGFLFGASPGALSSRCTSSQLMGQTGQTDIWVITEDPGCT